MNNKQKGFSLVELLAVIILLGAISLIIIPSIISTMSSSEKKAFEKSIIGLIESANNYTGNSEFSEWPASGYTVEELGSKEDFETKNIDKFISGRIYNDEGTIRVENITDGTYTASGTKNNLTVTMYSAYEIDTYDLNNFSNWRAGHYSWNTAIHEGYSGRIALNDYVSCKPGGIYKVDTGNGAFQIIIRAVDKNKKITENLGPISNGTTFTLKSTSEYLAISIYSASSAPSYDQYRELFKTSFNLSIIEQ